MSNSTIRKNILIDGKVVPTFLMYSFPWVLALLAISSAGIIDGIFIGKYCGTRQLAALNLVFPVYSIFMGVAIVFCVGGVVRYAKYLGEQHIQRADAIFTKTILTMIVLSFISLVVGYIFVDSIMSVLGVRGEALQYSRTYFMVVNIFAPCFMMSVTISSFIRADGNVFLAGFAPLVGVVVNVLLDYLLIVKFDMGVSGAAYATGISQLIGIIILCGHFFTKKNNLRFTKQIGKLSEIALTAYNGISELFSELSTGLIILLYNRVLMTMVGENGVAAFTMVSYLSFVVMMMAYGVSDNLGPIISANYGAKNKKRILQFLACALAVEFLFGVTMVLLLTFLSDNFILMFIDMSQPSANEVMALTLSFIAIFKWGFLLSGVNIVLSTFFTGLHLPSASLIVAIMRGIILPMSLLRLLPAVGNLGLDGVYMAMPISECITFMVAVVIFYFVWKKRSKELSII